MTTKKVKKTAKTQPQVPEDLINQVNSLRALATAYNLLQKGMFQYQDAALVSHSLNFLKALHEQLFAQAINHPSANLVPELAAQKSNPQKQEISNVHG